MTELWCEEFELQPGDILEATASTKELQDPFDQLNFEVWTEDDHISLWCPSETEFRIIEKDDKVESQ